MDIAPEVRYTTAKLLLLQPRDDEPKLGKGRKDRPDTGTHAVQGVSGVSSLVARLEELVEKAHLDAVERHGYFHPIADKAKAEVDRLKA